MWIERATVPTMVDVDRKSYRTVPMLLDVDRKSYCSYI